MPSIGTNGIEAKSHREAGQLRKYVETDYRAVWLWFYYGICWQQQKDRLPQALFYYSSLFFFYFPACPFLPLIPFSLFFLPPFPLSCQAWRPKTLLQHLRLRSSSGQMWRLALAQVSVQHPHTPQTRFARFRCSAGGRLSPLAPLSPLSTDGLSSLPLPSHLQFSWDNCATITCIPCRAH